MAIIFITGASSGIGFATALSLAQNGHKVYATMRNPQRSPDLQDIATKENLPINIIAMDVDDDASVKQAIENVLEKEGSLDVLINNAGIANLGATEELPLHDFRKQMETNYFGTIRCIQAILPSMRKRRSGCIINVTSVAAKVYGSFQGGYCATKAAVEAFSESLAQELVPYNIKVAVVEPGVIKTSIEKFLGEVLPSVNYPDIKRRVAFYAASFERNTSPLVVADVIKDIIDGKSNSFRNPAGPDALPFISHRASVSDEDWIRSVSMDEETWIAKMNKMGLNVKPYLAQEILPFG